jgi:predicted nuclease of predicted toxin-antitoxin system
MIRFLADENLNGRILRGIRRLNAEADIIRAQDRPVYQKPDPEVLEWAAQQGRILITHDVETMVAHARTRVVAGLPVPGSSLCGTHSRLEKSSKTY